MNHRALKYETVGMESRNFGRRRETSVVMIIHCLVIGGLLASLRYGPNSQLLCKTGH